jgi:hypothetical protein
VRPGSHAAPDGSFGRSAGIQVGRAVVLVAIAVVVGILLLYRTGHGGTGATAASSTGTTAKSKAKTTTTRPGTGSTAATSAVTTTTIAPARPASAVKVLVANGSGVSGLAGLTATKLHTAGYNTLAVQNATRQVTASIVYYQAGYPQEALVLATVLGLPATSVQPIATPPPVTNLSTANILVVAGPDLARATTTTPTTVHTATTAHVATTTTVKH